MVSVRDRCLPKDISCPVTVRVRTVLGPRLARVLGSIWDGVTVNMVRVLATASVTIRLEAVLGPRVVLR